MSKTFAPRIKVTGDDLLVIAENPAELVASQNALIDNVGHKVELARAELADAEQLLAALREAGLDQRAAERMINRAKSRVEYLVKVHEALSAGYVMVPDMPAETIAIRVKRKPRFQQESGKWQYGLKVGDEVSQSLPSGVGVYASPQPHQTFLQEESVENGKKEITHFVETTGEWDTDLRLPALFLKAQVVERTGKCLTRKLFDEIAINPGEGRAWTNAMASLAPAPASKGHPMVIGRIVDRATKKRLCFLIAWFIDTSGI